MKSTSEELVELATISTGARYYIRIVADGVEVTDSIDDFEYENMCNSDDTFTVGNTCSAKVSFKINEPSVSLKNKDIIIQQGIKLSDGTIEYLDLGIFRVVEQDDNRGVYSYELADRMVTLMESTYSSDLTYPTTDVAILQEICTQAGIELNNADSVVSHKIASAPQGYTKREMIAYLSQLQAKNAIINDKGNLELIWYTEVDYTVDDNMIYLDGADEINDETDYTIEYIECQTTNMDKTEEVTYKSGSGTIGIKLENPFMTQDILDEVFLAIGGFSFRSVEFDFLGDYRLEVGDVITLNTYGHVYKVPIMQLNHKSDGGVVTTVKSVAETEEMNNIDYRSPQTKAMDRYYAELVLINKAMINKLDVEQLEATKAEIEEAVIKNLSAEFVTAEYVKANYADISLANVEKATIGTVLADVGLITSATITDGHITGFLDAVEVNANNITAGTLSVDRLVFRGQDKSIVYALNNITGALQAVQSNTLNGEILTPRTITADKIVAYAITATEIAANAITADKILANSITAAKIASNAITTDKISANAITSVKIATGAITAEKIAANAITANKIMIGDFNNYATVSENFSESMITSFGGTLIEGSYVVKGTVTTGYLMLCDYTPNRLKRGEQIHYEMVVKRSANGELQPAIWFFDKNKTYLGSANGSNLTITTDATDISGTITINDYAIDAYYFVVGIRDNATTPGQIYARRIQFMRMQDGDLIVDGAITADKVAANAITANKLSVTSLSAITANLGTVTAGVLQSTNYVSGNSGMKLNLSNGLWDSKYFKLSSEGKITATGGKIGGFTINNVLTSTVSNVYINPTVDVAEKIKAYILDAGTLTDEELEWFDVSKDGTVDIKDAVAIRKIIAGTSNYEDYDGAKTSTVTFTINPSNAERLISLSVYAWGKNMENYIGINESRFTKIRASSIITDSGADLDTINPVKGNADDVSVSLGDIVENGVYWCDFSKVTNSPYTSGYGILEVFSPAETIHVQRITRINTTGSFQTATRFYANSKWYSWGIVSNTVSL